MTMDASYFYVRAKKYNIMIVIMIIMMYIYTYIYMHILLHTHIHISHVIQ